MPEREVLEESLGHAFTDPTLLERALVHRSALNERKDLHEHNERLEFLGDAVLELVATEHLYRTTDRAEGELTNWRSALVRTEHLAEVAQVLGIGAALLLSRGEELSGGREKSSTLANALEAVIGAIYLDAGLDAARTFIERTILERLADLLAANRHVDPKSRFQELAQEHLGATPEYRLASEKGPDHAKEFTMDLIVLDEILASGTGASKQAAEQDAARRALEARGWS